MSHDIQSILDEISGKMAALDGVVAYAWDAKRIEAAGRCDNRVSNRNWSAVVVIILGEGARC